MAIFKLFSFNAFIPLINSLALRKHQLPIWSYSALRRFPMSLILKFPKFNYSIISGEHLYDTLFIIYELYRIDLLVKLNRLQVIKFRLVALNLSEIAIIEIPWILKLIIFKNYDSASLVSYCKIFASLVICNSCQ